MTTIWIDDGHKDICWLGRKHYPGFQLRTGSGSTLYKTKGIEKYAAGYKMACGLFFFFNFATVIINFMY